MQEFTSILIKWN